MDGSSQERLRNTHDLRSDPNHWAFCAHHVVALTTGPVAKLSVGNQHSVDGVLAPTTLALLLAPLYTLALSVCHQFLRHLDPGVLSHNGRSDADMRCAARTDKILLFTI